jgi:protoporphyrinogen oxidase
MANGQQVVVIGAGPAGLTAAHTLVGAGRQVLVLERNQEAGGLARTLEHKGYLFDVGGHRFFTREPEIQRLWEEWMGGELTRVERLSRILYRDRFYHYPLRPIEALRNMGLRESAWVLASYLRKQLFPVPENGSFERWMINRFGPRLFIMFFKAYTEKVWGIPCSEIRAEWAAQRIRGLTLWQALAGALFPALRPHRTLIRSFQYPARGPGQLWERVADLVTTEGATIKRGESVVALRRSARRLEAVETEHASGRSIHSGTDFLSTQPLGELILALRPAAPDDVQSAARALRHRAFICVALILRRRDVFPDNWIYVHSPEARVARIQNFKNWSAAMVPDAETTGLGLEYFCDVGDALWTLSDAELVSLAKRDLELLDMATPDQVAEGVVVRQTHAYPVYDRSYGPQLARLRDYLSEIENLHVAGRNGLHRYDNQDHAMLSGLLAARNLLGEEHDVWAVNASQQHHETAG